MTIQTDNYGIGASGTASQKFTLTAPNDGTLKIGRGVLGAESSFPIVINADDSISGNMGIGAGQTWQDVTGSRVSGTTYTNSTGKAIVVSISGQSTSGSSHSVTVDGLTIVIAGGGSTTRPSTQFPVPDGSTYSVSITNGAGLIWSELR